LLTKIKSSQKKRSTILPLIEFPINTSQRPTSSECDSDQHIEEQNSNRIEVNIKHNAVNNSNYDIDESQKCQQALEKKTQIQDPVQITKSTWDYSFATSLGDEVRSELDMKKEEPPVSIKRKLRKPGPREAKNNLSKSFSPQSNQVDDEIQIDSANSKGFYNSRDNFGKMSGVDNIKLKSRSPSGANQKVCD